MTTQFGWFDTLHALSTCLACTAASSSTDSLHDYAHNTRITRQSSGSGSRARTQTNTQFLTDGLRPLLQEESTDDEYADALSLHSNVGDVSRGEEEGTRRVCRVKSKRRGKKVRQDEGWFTIFGYNLFGKRTGAIQLPLSDDEDEEEPNRSEGRISRTRSGSTLDSDAAQLDDAAIAALSRTHIADQAQAVQTAEEMAKLHKKQAEKEERRRKRKERKQREALERALAAGLSLDRNGGGEFEGYQGSGDDVRVPGPGNPPHSASSRSTGTSITLTGGDADDEELADFDGSVYTRAAVNVTGAGGNSSGSRTTTSTNTRSSGASGSRRHLRTHETADPFHVDPAIEPSFTVHLPNSVNDQVKQKRAKTHRTKPTLPSSSSVAASDSGRTTSTQSVTDSLPSPTGSTSLGPGLSLSLSSPHDQAQVSQQPHLTRNDGKTQKSIRGLAQGGPFYDREPNRGFPSVGFGRGRGDSLVNGAFLARRGDE